MYFIQVAKCETRSIESKPAYAVVTRVAMQVGTSKKPDTLVLFPSSVREPKIEGLNLYISVYLCPVRAEIFNRTSRLKTGQSGSKPDTWQP